jgi:hypothetical protein
MARRIAEQLLFERGKNARLKRDGRTMDYEFNSHGSPAILVLDPTDNEESIL